MYAKVFVSYMVDITPDVHIGAGWVEVGIERILGVATRYEAAITLLRTEVDKVLEQMAKEPDWEDWEEITDFIDYSHRYHVKECELIV